MKSVIITITAGLGIFLLAYVLIGGNSLIAIAQYRLFRSEIRSAYTGTFKVQGTDKTVVLEANGDGYFKERDEPSGMPFHWKVRNSRFSALYAVEQWNVAEGTVSLGDHHELFLHFTKGGWGSCALTLIPVAVPKK